MKFSILIVTYNPIWEKLLFTLESIMKQKFEDYEIIISDDGSKDNCFDKIQKYFEKYHFAEYQLLSHEKNQGTVKNIIDALEHAKGKYIRDFGPGDGFYSKNSLQQVYDFLSQNDYEACFGLMRGYCVDSTGEIRYSEFQHPFDIEAYKRHDKERIKKNLVLYRDNASGACTCYTKEYYLNYLKRIENIVIYTEDIFQIMAGIDERELQFYPNYLVWYETDTGVSTKKKTHFTELLDRDVEEFYRLLQKEYPKETYVIKQKKVAGLYKIRNLYLRTAIRVFVNPDAIRYLISHILQKKRGNYDPKKQEQGFLEQQGFVELVRGEKVCR